MSTLWDLLRTGMATRGIPNAAALARETGVPESTISRLRTVSGRHPSTLTLRKLARGTGVHVFDMLLALGWTAEELRGTDRRDLSNEELLSVLRDRLIPTRTGAVVSDETATELDSGGTADVPVDPGADTDLPVGQGAETDEASVEKPGEDVNDAR